MKEHAEIEPVVMKYREYKTVKSQFEEQKKFLKAQTTKK